MTTDIDYEAMYRRLVLELEEARLQIIKMRYERRLVESVNPASLKRFVEENYLVIIVMLTLFSVIISSLRTIKGLLERRRHEIKG